MSTAASTRQLASGHRMPVIGYGTYETTPEVTESVVSDALKLGIRLIDTAAFYNNESGCGRAIVNSGIARKDVFVTTKVAPNRMGCDGTAAAVDESLRVSGLSYIDLYLIHAPFGDANARNGTWEALSQAVLDGKVRDIGVCNYGLQHLEELEKHRATLPPQLRNVPISVAQYELHPYMPRPDIVKYASSNDILLQAFGPLVLGKKAADDALRFIAAKHEKTWAQVLVRWSIQQGFTPLPKSVNVERTRENIDVFDFALDDQDLERLSYPDSYELNRGHWDPTAWGFTGPGSKP